MGGNGAFVHFLDKQVGTAHGYAAGHFLALVVTIVTTVVFVEPRFSLSVVGGVIAEEEELVVLRHGTQVATFCPDKHGAVIFELDGFGLSIVNTIINAHVVAAEVDTHDSFALRIETGAIVHHLRTEDQVTGVRIFSVVLDRYGETGGCQGHGVDIIFVQFLPLSGRIGNELSHLRRVVLIGCGLIIRSEEITTDIAQEFSLLLEDGLELLRRVRSTLGVEIVVLPIFRDEVGPHDDLSLLRHPLDGILAGVEFDLLSIDLNNERNCQRACIVESGREARIAVIAIAKEAGKRVFEDIQADFREGEREIVGSTSGTVVDFEIEDSTFREFGAGIGRFCPTDYKFVVAEQFLHVAHQLIVPIVVVGEGEIGLQIDRNAAFEKSREGIFQIGILRHRTFVTQLSAFTTQLLFPLTAHALKSAQFHTFLLSALGIDVRLKVIEMTVEVFDEEIELL